jgi:chromosome segregation ATPase
MSNITRDEGIDALRTARQGIEDMLANAARMLHQNHHTIQAMEIRIAELENEVLIQKSYASEYHADCAVKDACITQLEAMHTAAVQQAHDALDEADSLKAENKQLRAVMADRARNVTRLASAGFRHLAADRTAIAMQLLAPLARGVHDAYKYDGDIKTHARPRSSDDATDIRVVGRAGLYPYA